MIRDVLDELSRIRKRIQHILFVVVSYDHDDHKMRNDLPRVDNIDIGMPSKVLPVDNTCWAI